MNKQASPSRQAGFTMIEMVAVIVILAVLAANALPRFANMSNEARVSSVNGLAGGLRSAVSLVKAKWLVANSADQSTANMNGTNITVISAGTAAPVSTQANLGLPLYSAAGIDNILDALSGYTSGATAAGEAWWPTGVTISSSCFAEYNSGTGAITTTVTNCS